MAVTKKKGKAVKAKKVEHKTKAKPKATKKVAKPKVAKAVKKATAPAKKVSAKKSSTAKVAKKPVKAPAVKATKVKKEVVKTVVATKIVKEIKANGSKAKASKTETTKTSVQNVPVVKKNEKFELGVVLRTGRRPEAILTKKKSETVTMGEERLRYSEEELKEFEVLIIEKLDKAKKELVYMKEMLSKKNDEGTDNTGGTMKLLEDGADTLEKENFSQLAVRQQKFVTQLENALARIKNGTYGVCIDTGKLIPKERLKAVPHTQHSIEAKLNRR